MLVSNQEEFTNCGAFDGDSGGSESAKQWDVQIGNSEHGEQ